MTTYTEQSFELEEELVERVKQIYGLQTIEEVNAKVTELTQQHQLVLRENYLKRQLTPAEIDWLINQIELIIKLGVENLDTTQKLLLIRASQDNHLQHIINNLLITDQTSNHDHINEFLDLLQKAQASNNLQTRENGDVVVDDEQLDVAITQLSEDASNENIQYDSEEDDSTVATKEKQQTDVLDLFDREQTVDEILGDLNTLLTFAGDVDSIKVMQTIRQLTFQKLLNRILTQEEETIQEITTKSAQYKGLTLDVIEEILAFYKEAKKFQSPDCVIEGFQSRYLDKADKKHNTFVPNLLQCMEILNISRFNSRLNLSDPGLGKTDSTLLGAVYSNVQRLLVFCPCSVIPGWIEKVQARYPHFRTIINSQQVLNWNWKTRIPKDEPIIAIINWDKLVDEKHPKYLPMMQWIEKFNPDMVVGDEIQFCKERDSKKVSSRRESFTEVVRLVRELNENCKLYHLTGSPCPNEYTEAIGCLKSATNFSYAYLNTEKTLMNGLDVFVEVSQLSTRVRNLPKDFTVTQHNVEIDDDAIFEDIRKAGVKWTEQTSLTLPSKLAYVKELLKDPSPIVLFTPYVEDVVSQIEEFLIDEGYGDQYVVHTGTDKGGVQEFRTDDSKRILIGSIGSMGCGVDGIQEKASRIVYLGYPWTYEEKKQADGRCARFGQKHDVTIYNLVSQSTAEVDGDTRTISFDGFVLDKHLTKKALSSLCIDGIVPDHIRDKFKSGEMSANTSDWQNHLEGGQGMTRIQFQERFVPPSRLVLPSQIVPRHSFSDLSQEHARCKASYSSNNYQRYLNDPDTWVDYHTKLSSVRNDWHPDPVKVIAAKIRSMGQDLTVMDFGCGREMLKSELGINYNTIGFDYISHSPSVLSCDLAGDDVPQVSAGDVGVAINSLMSKDWVKMIPSFRTLLKGTGQLFLVNPKAQIKVNLIQEALTESGFKVIDTWTDETFNYIRAIVD